MAVSLVALFVALGGPAQAERLIGSKQIRDRSLQTRDLSRRAVRRLAATPNGSIGASKLAPAAVTTPALAPGSVLTGSVGDNSLTAADLASSSVDTEEVADNAVGQTEIRNNGVAASEIADNSIDGGEIIDGGLSTRDIARNTGTFTWAIDALPPGACRIGWVQLPGAQIAGDFILVSPTSAWPRDLVYTANGTSSESEFKVQACNSGVAVVPAAGYLFNYAVLGG